MSATVIFIFDELFESMVSPSQLARLRALPAELHIITKKCTISEHELLKDPDTQKILCINPDFVDWDFAADAYKNIPGLRVIISSSDNISWLDTTYADEHGIPYVALEDLNTEYSAVAEYAITILTSLARNMPKLARDGYPLDYAHDFLKYQGMDLAGKTVGIVGLGNIGGAIAKLCAGLGMHVTYWSRTEKPESGYEYRQLNDLLKDSDVIFPTLKPNDETKTMLPNDKLEYIKNDAIVVCVVSGLVDTAYLTKRVASDRLFGCGFGADTGASSNYVGNVWAIPDYAWATRNNMQATYDQFVEKIAESIDG